jgi:hypothetical protein
MPYTHSGHYDYSDENGLQRPGLTARFAKLTQIYEQIKDLHPTPLAEKFIRLMDKYGQYCLQNLPRAAVTEEFIDYALARDEIPYYDALYSVYNDYTSEERRRQREAQEAEARLQRQQQEEERRQREARSRIAPHDHAFFLVILGAKKKFNCRRQTLIGHPAMV